MKIKRLKIDSYRHLENLEFDFTYQSGDKKGQPLNKICLIGQSAVGKTSILEFIKESVTTFSIWHKVVLVAPPKQQSKSIVKPSNVNVQQSRMVKIAAMRLNGEIDFLINNLPVLYSKKTLQLKQNVVDSFPSKILIYFSSELLSPANNMLFSNNFENINNINSIITKLTNANQVNISNNDNVIEKIENKKIIIFGGNNEMAWQSLLNEIIEYRLKLTQKGSDLINKGLHADFRRMASEMELWRKRNPNPAELLAEKCLNPILKRLNLEVDLVDTTALIVLKPINDDKAIPSNALSTGTKQLLLNLLPLYKLDTQGSIVLIDEPERSLYPDIQIELMDHYQRLAPDAQFIVATHSPFIAAAFEPEERFILYFDEEGKVAVRNGSSPIGDDPNDILKSDFGLTHLMNEKGIDAYRRYIKLKEEMASEKDADKKDKLLLEVVTLGNKYKF